MKCSNCDKDALFEYKLTLEKSVFYCERDLPAFLYSRKKAGLLAITNRFTEAKNEAKEILSPPIVEQTIEEPAEEPAPKKKASKKKAE